MTINEALEVIEKLRKKYDDEEIIKMLIRMYLDDKLEYGALLEFVEILGYEFTPEFLKRLKEKNVNV